MKNILLSEKSWHDKLFHKLDKRSDENWLRINDKKDFRIEYLKRYDPERIFIPHWSQIIPKEIYERYECILFHMTDLPYGRGGSPLQNLIVRGHKETKISALMVEDGIDTGKIYIKYPLSLSGTAHDIFMRSSNVIYDMICEIIEKSVEPIEQLGEIVEFNRRGPRDGDFSKVSDLKTIYDYIRMLDCDGYPPSFIELNNFKFEFTGAEIKSEEILANVRITKK